MRSTRKCIVCGKEYEFCGGCKRKLKPSWMNLYHDENCREIWHSITTFYDKDGAVAAAERLSNLDLSAMDNFSEGVREKIEKIFSEAFDAEETEATYNEEEEAGETQAEADNVDENVEVVEDDDFDSKEE